MLDVDFNAHAFASRQMYVVPQSARASVSVGLDLREPPSPHSSSHANPLSALLEKSAPRSEGFATPGGKDAPAVKLADRLAVLARVLRQAASPPVRAVLLGMVCGAIPPAKAPPVTHARHARRLCISLLRVCRRYSSRQMRRGWARWSRGCCGWGTPHCRHMAFRGAKPYEACERVINSEIGKHASPRRLNNQTAQLEGGGAGHQRKCLRRQDGRHATACAGHVDHAQKNCSVFKGKNASLRPPLTLTLLPYSRL